MSILDKILKKKTDKLAINSQEVEVKKSAKDKKKQVETKKAVSKLEVKKETKVSTVSKKTSDWKNFPVYRVLIRPVITEKATDLSVNNQYIFEISKQATKNEIKKAVAGRYGVKIKKVNLINVRGKQVRYGRTRGKTKSWRKAIVTLQAGDKIEL